MSQARPQARPRPQRPRPLIVLAGFLGSGKTSFLRALVPALLRRGLRSRVILNDLENAEIDAATLRDLQAELAPLSGNCLCCESQEDLLAALRDRATAEAPAYDVVLLEMNGATDTGLLLETLAEAPGLEHLSSPLQVTTIDAVKFEQRGWMNAIEREQLATSSHLRLSKIDRVDEARARAVRATVSSRVPHAVWTDADGLAAEIASRKRGDPARVDTPGPRDRARSLSESPHRHAFLSCQIAIPFAVDGASFEAFLRALPADIVRAKGVVILRDPAGEKRSFQLAAGYSEVSPCALQDPESLAPVAVFVGSGIDVPALLQRIAALATASASSSSTVTAGAMPSAARKP